MTADDRRVLDQVLQWYFWLVFALQEAKIQSESAPHLVFGESAHTPDPQPSPVVGAAMRAGRRPRGTRGAAAEKRVPWRGAEKTWAERHRGVVATARATGAWALRPMGVPSAWSAATRSWRWVSAARCAVRATSMRCPPGVEIRIDGNALLSAMRYELEKLRCSACGEIFTAGLPGGLVRRKYSAQARAVLAVSRYYLGVPGYRLQGYQAMLGVPVPDATQWDQIEVVGDCAYKVFEQMEREAAQGELIFQDDTAVRILSLMQRKPQTFAAAQAQGLSTPKERTGMHTTALAVQVGEHTAILYYSSRRHAGENLQGLLDKRGGGSCQTAGDVRCAVEQ